MATLIPLQQPGASTTNKDVRIRKVLVRDLVLDAYIGVYAQEQGRTQKIRINIELDAIDRGKSHADKLENVVCYQDVIDACRDIVQRGHVNLVETLAELIAEVALHHADVLSAKVRVEKLEAVREAAAVGVEIIRTRNDYPL